MVHMVHVALDIHEQHDLVLHNTNKKYLSVDVAALTSWRAWILSYQFAWGFILAKLSKAKLALQMENSFVLSIVQNFFVLLMWVHGAFLVDIQKTCCHIE
jgi:hypothetical protein